MTAILLDEQPVEHATATTVGELVASVRAGFDPRRRMIVALQCDGHEVPIEAIDETLRRRVTDFTQLRLISDQPRRVALAALRQVEPQLNEARELRIRVADGLTESRVTDAMDSLASLIRICAQAHQAAIQSAVLVGLDPRDLHAAEPTGASGAPSFATQLESVTQGLRQLREALVQQDFVLLADQMRYEMESALDAWSMLVRTVLAAVESLPVDPD